MHWIFWKHKVTGEVIKHEDYIKLKAVIDPPKDASQIAGVTQAHFAPTHEIPTHEHTTYKKPRPVETDEPEEEDILIPLAVDAITSLIDSFMPGDTFSSSGDMTGGGGNFGGGGASGKW